MCTITETTGLEQELIKDIEGERIYTPGMQELARKSAAEGCVLLKNNGVLPFPVFQYSPRFVRLLRH